MLCINFSPLTLSGTVSMSEIIGRLRSSQSCTYIWGKTQINTFGHEKIKLTKQSRQAAHAQSKIEAGCQAHCEILHTYIQKWAPHKRELFLNLQPKGREAERKEGKWKDSRISGAAYKAATECEFTMRSAVAARDLQDDVHSIYLLIILSEHHVCAGFSVTFRYEAYSPVVSVGRS